MKFFNCNWDAILKFCLQWERIPKESQLLYLHTLTPSVIPVANVNLFMAKPLVYKGFLKFSSSKKNYEFTEEAKHFHSFLTGLLCSEMFDNIEDTTKNLIEYLSFFYTERELTALTSNFRATRRDYEEIGAAITGAYRLKQFLDAGNLQAWEVEYNSVNRLPVINTPTENKHFKIAQKILRELIDGPTAIHLAEIAKIADTDNTKLIGKAISLLLEKILVFVSFSKYVNSPVIGIHPLAHHFINPGEMKLVKSETPVTSCPPFLVDDMTIMLTEASLDPIPLRQSDNKPYAKSIKAITSKFYKLPPECNHLFQYTDEERVRMAMFAITKNDLASIHGKKKDKKNYLYAEEEGRYWLKLSDRDRLEEILTIEQEYHNRFYNLNRSSFPLDSKCLSKIKIIRDEFSVPYTTPNLAGSLYGALKILADVKHPVTETSFFERQVFLENPLFTLLQCGIPYMNTTDWRFQNIVDKQEMVNFWLRSLQSFIVSKAIPFGMLNISPIPGEHDNAISLSDAGLFFTGNLKKLPAAKQSGDSVLIQPNFEIVFMTQNPRAEVKLGQFCERLSSGIGTLFKITRNSTQKGASNGLDVEYVLRTMTELSHKAVPPNVAEQVKNWISQCRIVSISTKILFTCPDRETALQIKSSGGEKVEQISDIVIAVSDRKYAKVLEKKLEKKGIFKKKRVISASIFRQMSEETTGLCTEYSETTQLEKNSRN